MLATAAHDIQSPVAGVELPAIIPIFPLPNVVFFPGVPLPLHIFEPRYRDMIRDASASHGVIGMALLRGDWRPTYEGSPEIFDVGCAGRLASVEELPDGRFNILLHGLREFRIVSHSFDKTYRQAEVEWRPFPAELPPDERQRLTAAVERFLHAQPDSPLHRLLNDASLAPELLVNFLCYALDFEPLEKQGLLQAENLTARAQALGELIDFRLESGRSSMPESGSERPH